MPSASLPASSSTSSTFSSRSTSWTSSLAGSSLPMVVRWLFHYQNRCFFTYFVLQIFFAFRFWPWRKWKMTKGQTPWLGFSQRFIFYLSPGTIVTSSAQITKCTFHKFGASGSVQKFDGICVLPLNIINEKIYVFLWFWFLLLAASFASKMISSMWPSFNFAGDHKDSDDISSQRSCPAMSSCNPAQGLKHF